MDFSSALHAKVAGVPVVAAGIPLVIVGALVARSFASKKSGSGSMASAPADGNPTGDAQPIFIAKAPPSNWLALDPTTGTASSSDGTTYAPVSTGIGGSSGGSANLIGTPSTTDGIPAGGSAVTPPLLSNPAPSPSTGTTAPPSVTPTTSVNVKVAKGDNWQTLAAKNGLTMNQLIAANGGNGAALAIGQTIKVPKK